jgi:DNA sulfur modification protein DndE
MGDVMTKNFFLFLSLLITFIVWKCAENGKIRIHLIGDSTMANKPVEANPEYGWGQMLQEFFSEKAQVINYAVNGRSSKSFIDEGRWQTVLDSLRAGDYVFIQFGHNDEKEYDSTRYAAPHGEYKDNLEKFVRESRAKGSIPVLLTPIVRRRFDEQGQFYGTHGDYPDVVRNVAADMNVSLIDMNKLSRELIINEGVEGSKRIYIFVKPGQYPRFHEGREDNTHFCEYGARQMAKLAVQEIKAQNIKLTNYLLNNN